MGWPVRSGPWGGSTEIPNADEPGAGVTRDLLMAEAPIPAMCDHPAQTMVLGQLVSPALNRGGATLENVVQGDLTGDGVLEAVGMVSCSAGGVGWPPWIIAWTLSNDAHPQMLAAIESNSEELMRLAPEGGGRTFVADVMVANGQIHVGLRAQLPADPTANPRLPVTAVLDFDEESAAFAVSEVRVRFDLAAVTTLLQEFRYSTGITDEVDPSVTRAVEEYLAANVGVEVGTCVAYNELSAEFQTKVGNEDHSEASRYCTLLSSQLRPAEPLLLKVVPEVGDVSEVVQAFS